jgi:hypothetical protein
MKAIFVALRAVLFFSILCSGPALAVDSSRDLPGVWSITAELVASSSENPNDPYAPKPGMIKSDVWSISEGDIGPVLTGSSGSISGQYANDGAVFDGSYPLGSGVLLNVHIECAMTDATSMYGINENVYWGTNTVTGEMIKLGIESWKFQAKKQ